jgi:hypothetical protein
MRALIRTALVLAVGAGLVVGAIRLPDLRYHLAGSGSSPAAARAAGPVTAATKPVTRSVLVCPGPETVGVKGVDAKKALAPTTVRVAAPPSDLLAAALSGDSASTGSTGSGSVDATAIGSSGALDFTSLVGPGAATTETSQARSILLSGKGSLAPGIAAAQATLVTTGDQRGLSTSTCQTPDAQVWLVGGGGEPGRRGRVVLTNPSPNGVTVDLDVFGAKGQVRSPAARGIVVGAHRRTVVLLDAIAPGERSPVIHVVASGGLISAALNDSWLDGTTPAGADDVVGTSPGSRLLIPGVVAGGTPGSTTLRIAATSREAVVKVRLLGVDGPTAAPVNNGVVRVAAHRVKDVDLSAVPAGYYGVELNSDEPVVAGVQVRTAAATPTSPRDLSWTSAQPAVTTLAGYPLGPTAAPWASSLALSAPTDDSTLDLVLVAADGTQTTQPVTVAAGTTKTVPLTTPAASLWLRVHTGTVSAAVLTAYADPAGQLRSVAPLSSGPLRTTPIAVYPLGG